MLRPILMTLLTNVRLASRSLLKRPAFSGMAVVILALGIGANTAIFSVVNAVLLRSLPYGDPSSLVAVFADGTARGQGGRLPITAGDFAWWRDRANTFTGLAAMRNDARRITSVETPVVPLAHAVSANYFDVLGSRPALGRGFVTGEDEPGRSDVVVLGYGLWHSVFGADPEIVGRKIDLDGEPHTVVGVMGPDFYSAHLFAVQPGIFFPKAFSLLRDDHGTRDVVVYGRVRAGESVAAAQAEMTAITKSLAAEHPETNDRWGAAVIPIRELAVGPFGATGSILLAAVSLVLLIACANVANLTFSRASERSLEMALRVALGASRRRIISQLMTESLLLSLAGGAVGALLAFLAADPLARLIPAQAGVPFLDRVGVDGSVLAFTLLLSVVSGLLFGLFPAREATRVDLAEVLREGGRSQVSSRGRRFRNGLVVAEVALAVVVATGAGLMLRTIGGLQTVKPGFDAGRLLSLRTSLRGDDFAAPAARRVHFEELKRRLEALPGIASASATSFEPPMPVAGVFGGARLSIPGFSDDSASPTSAVSNTVMPDFFETLGIPLIKGRGITKNDQADSRRVVVINQAMVDRFFPGVDPLGRSFALHGPGQPQMEIVGVVGNVITAGTDPTPRPVFYAPYAQNPIPVMTVVMRVPQGDPLALAREAEKTAWSLSRSTAVYFVRSMDNRMADLNWQPRFGALLLGGFAALALLLGGVGIYAVISYTVLQRQAEIGLRMALGARASEVLAMVLKGGLRLTAKGLLGGLIASLVVTRVLDGFLYGVSPNDPATLVSVCVLLLGVAASACLVPAIRASRVLPSAILRG
ncbi:MAG: ABC transporter permease [Vicinamibacteria bacterium]|nr:ABC transporter permease [Vicinamibacteria bacterium]